MNFVVDDIATLTRSGFDPETLKQRFESRSATVGVIGLGYVGLPLVKAINAGGFRVTGFDIDRDKVAQLRSGRSYIRTVSSESLCEMIDNGRFRATVDFAKTTAMDAILICVPDATQS